LLLARTDLTAEVSLSAVPSVSVQSMGLLGYRQQVLDNKIAYGVLSMIASLEIRWTYIATDTLPGGSEDYRLFVQSIPCVCG
jgi:hypothetical protein